jgi:peptide/nickel transport system substrate-binding protein
MKNNGMKDWIFSGGNICEIYRHQQKKKKERASMKRKIGWLLFSFLLISAMILTSCGTESTSTGEKEIIKGKVTTSEPEAVKPADTTRTEKPQYGAIATFSLGADISGFDEAFTGSWATTTLHLTNEELLEGDWTKGPAGTGEANFILGGINAMNLKTGCLADSWQIPERGKMIFHIREGVYWHNKATTNGRELTVDDVVFSMKRMCTEPRAYIKNAYSNLAKAVVITGDEAARTVTIECPVSLWVDALTVLPDLLTIMPRDAIEKFGNMNDWHNSIGTGPFILTDYISNGSANLVRNPNYWGTNPIGPGKGDQLPYLEGVKFLVITDTSTRLTAFRTAKIEGTSGEYDDVKEFVDNPDVKSMMYIGDSCSIIAMRTDKAESPFSKKEVRQALTMATDFNKIKNEYYNGHASILVWPISYSKENAAAYVPMEKLPSNVQELYSHNVTKARELLTAAGYPTLKTSIICSNTPTAIDFLSLLKEMWAEVGVDLTIDAKDYTTWLGRTNMRNYSASELLYTGSSGSWQSFDNINGPKQFNASYINDPIIAEAAAKVSDYIGIDDAKVAQLNADLMPYVIEQCWVIAKPNSYAYVIWWPWRKNWNGELNLGFYNYPNYLKYTWTDQTLKRQMTQR